MKIRSIIFAAITSLSTLGFVSNAFATIDILLTQGNTSAIPVSVVGFNSANTSNTSIAEVIKHDLAYSGDFNVKSGTAVASDIAYWREQGVDDIISGSVIPAGGGRYRVTCKIENLFSASQASGKLTSQILLNESFTATPAQFRALAHHISDIVYEKLTGKKGIFSTKLAYLVVQNDDQRSTKYRLEVSDADGYNPQTILVSKQPILSPAWSPNGHQLAYVSFENQQARLFIQDLKTGKRQVISQQPGLNNAPSFSPDGRTLALVLSVTGNPKIYTMDLATGHLTQQTFGSAIDTEPSFTPDGKAILFTSGRGGAPQIYEKNLASGDIKRLTYNGDYNARPRVLHNGDGFVMMHRESDLFGIAKQDFTDGRFSILSNEGGDESPSVAPNDRLIIYATRLGGRGVLAIVSVDGKVRMRLPARDGDVREPAWSPLVG